MQTPERDMRVGYMESLRAMSDTDLLIALSGWQPGTQWHLVVQAEIDRRKEVKASEDARLKHERETRRFWWAEFRSWVSVAISLAALAVAAYAALKK
jgi:hypothetical protein